MRAWILTACLLLAVCDPAHAQQQDLFRTQSGATVPVPDPTTLTVELLNREVATLKEQITTANEAQRELNDAKFAALRELIDLQVPTVTGLARDRDQMLQEAEKRVAALRELVFERFSRVDIRFENVATQFAERAAAVATALNALETAGSNARAAADRAVTTAGIVTKESIDQQARLFYETTQGLRANVDDLKVAVGNLEARTAGSSEVNALAQRLTAIEARTAGIGEAKTNFGENIGILGIIGGLVLGAIGFFVGDRRREQGNSK